MRDLPVASARPSARNAALQDEPNVLAIPVPVFVDVVVGDEADRGWPPHVDLQLFLRVGRWRQADPVLIEHRVLNDVLGGEARPDVVAGVEATGHVANPDAQFHHDGRVAGFGQVECARHQVHDGLQVRPRVEQPELRFHGESVRAFLDDAGAFAVVLSHDDQGAPGDPGGAQIGQGVRRDVGADHGFERDGAADRIVDRRAQHGRGPRLIGAGFQMDAETAEQVAGVAQHVDQR
jgi:hypothetical protein